MFNRKYIFIPGPFSIAMLVYQGVEVSVAATMELFKTVARKPLRLPHENSHF